MLGFLTIVAKAMVVGSKLLSLLVGGAALAATGWVLFGLARGDVPALPFFPQTRGVDAPESTPATEDETLDPALEFWDQRFAEAQANKPVRFEDLSPRSRFQELRAFIRQEGLAVKTGGRSKESVYTEIAALLAGRPSASQGAVGE